jgi:hypothetical protein
VQHVEAMSVPSLVGLVVKNGWNSLLRYSGGCPWSRTRISCSSRRESCRSGVRALLLVRLPASASHRGQAGRTGVAERPVLPMKPGNAGRGKGP